MSTEIRSGLYYSKDHEWVRVEGDQAYIGITDFAQSKLGNIVFVELPEIGSEFEMGDSMAVIESVKAASDVYAPVSGIVIGVNEELEKSPDLLNTDPYGQYIAIIKMKDKAELEELMNSEEYAKYCEEE